VIKNPIRWPDGARCAVAFTFDMDAESLMHLYFGDTAPNRVGMAAMLRYDAEVAVPRLLDVLRRYGLRQTFFVPGWCIEHYPGAVEAILGGGHELAHHGYMHEKFNQLSRDDQRAAIQRALEAIVKVSGRRPRGFRAPSYSFARHTLGLLLDEGFEYDSSLKGDDIPYHITDGSRALIELPTDLSLDDWTQYVCLKDFGYMLPIASPRRAMEVFRAEFDAAWKYGGLWIAVWHPFVSGRMSRADAIAGLIEHMQGKGGVWFATLEEIAGHVRREVAGGWTPRVDRLPYYERPVPGVLAGPGILPGWEPAKAPKATPSRPERRGARKGGSPRASAGARRRAAR
jgi:peptidoglycan/xylan/chitin deacetylase (PgdA/CDA1 family)